MTAHRKVPILFTDAPRGTCRWCGIVISGCSNKTRRRWHATCLEEYYDCLLIGRQRKKLIERDGTDCAICGLTLYRAKRTYDIGRTTDGDLYSMVRWELVADIDHRMPLWKVANLSPEQRLKYFRLENLQLIHFDPCHIKKSAIESAERAHVKRLVKGPQRGKHKMHSRGFSTTHRRLMNGRTVRK